MLKFFGITCAALILSLMTSNTCIAQDKGSNSLEMSLVDQELLTTTLSANTGDNVHCGLQDKAGNLWFGGDGLSRYNGEEFSHFTSNVGLTNTSIWTILEDSAGDFWIGTKETDLYRYDGIRFVKYSE